MLELVELFVTFRKFCHFDFLPSDIDIILVVCRQFECVLNNMSRLAMSLATYTDTYTCISVSQKAEMHQLLQKMISHFTEQRAVIH